LKDLNGASVPCGPIYSIDQVFDDAQVQHLGIAQDVPNARTAWSASRSRCRARQPGCGATAAVRRAGRRGVAEYGFTEDEIGTMKQGNVVGEPGFYLTNQFAAKDYR
jgi:crotonobetainyl-CoA:carnitine CoA-transferase CaiB-like acyl-CoA transferase